MPRPRILVADDDAAVRAGVCRLLGRRYDLAEASEGSEVIARVEAGETFDAILLDLEMPVLDGRRTLERLRVIAPELARRTLIVTGGATTEGLQRWLSELPSNRVLWKPVELARLVVAVEGLLLGEP
jgi:CheY-like chemotaxis protein